jgi:hypothetical protein
MSKPIDEIPARNSAVSAAPLLGQLRELIAQARAQALRALDSIQVRTCWEIGRHIVEFEQDGQARAAYGKRLLPMLAEQLTRDFGKGFDERNLRHMRAFYQSFPIWDAVRSELSWTHSRLLTRVDNETARQWYMNEAAEQNWTRISLTELHTLHTLHTMTALMSPLRRYVYD